jgi:hypothetical protein
VEKDFHPTVQGQGPRKGERGSKRLATRCDRLGYVVVLYYSLGGPLSQDNNPNFILIK